jgi:hypothetical protein
VNQAYYVEIWKRLHETVLRERPELWPSGWLLHHDNAPVHKQFLAQKSITEMEHPPISLISLRMTSSCFLNIKSALKGRRFRDIQ